MTRIFPLSGVDSVLFMSIALIRGQTCPLPRWDHMQRRDGYDEACQLLAKETSITRHIILVARVKSSRSTAPYLHAIPSWDENVDHLPRLNSPACASYLTRQHPVQRARSADGILYRSSWLHSCIWQSKSTSQARKYRGHDLGTSR